MAREEIKGVKEELNGSRLRAETLNVVDDEDVDAVVVVRERLLDILRGVHHRGAVVIYEFRSGSIHADALRVVDREIVLDGLE